MKNRFGIMGLSFLIAVAGCADDEGGAGPVGADADAHVTDALDVADPDATVADAGPGADALADALADVLIDATQEDITADTAQQDAADTTDAADAGDVPPPVPAGVVEKVTDPSQLIGGLAAVGQVDGAWVVRNDVARFLVQDKEVSAGLNLYGGNLVDADLVRESEPGNDRFREMFGIVGFRVSTAETVTVLDDGSSGIEAALRVTGTDEKSRIVDVLDSLVGQEFGFTIHNDYIVRPGIAGVLVRTTVENPTEKSHSDLLVGDLLSFGKMLQLFYAESGFGEPEAGLVTRLVGRGDGVSYGYARPSGSFLLPLVDASGTGAMYEEGLQLPAGGQDSFERWFVVGTGDVASVMEVLDHVRGEAAWALEGTVRELGTDEPLAGVEVTALVGEGADARAYNQALTREDGTYRMTLQPGVAYTLVTSGEGRPNGELVVAPLVTDPTDPTEIETVDLTIGAPGFVEVDLGGPARVLLQGVDVPSADERLGQDKRVAGTRPLFSYDGGGKWPVRPGTYNAVISRGSEYDTVVQQVVVEEAKTTLIDVAPTRVVDTTSWVAGDFHLHTVQSLDADSMLHEKVAELVAGGIEVAAATEHDNLADYGPTIAAMGVGDLLHAMVGNEISVNSVGHFNAYPLPLLADPFELVGAKFWAGRTVQELLDHVRAVSPEAIFQLNHPRSKNKGYLLWNGFDPVAGVATVDERPLVQGFDAIEVNSEIGSVDQYVVEMDAQMAKGGQNGSASVPVMRDWFGMLNSGLTVAAVGNSDSHDFDDGAGYPRTLLRVGTDAPSEVTDQMVEEAIRAQRVVVSKGPFITVRVGGEERMGHLEPVAVVDGAAELQITVQAPPWVGVDRLEVYENGRPLRLSQDEDGALVATAEGPLWVDIPAPGDPTDVVRFDGVVRVSPVADAWYVIVVRGAGATLPVFGGSSFAYTNPVYVTVP